MAAKLPGKYTGAVVLGSVSIFSSLNDRFFFSFKLNRINFLKILCSITEY